MQPLSRAFNVAVKQIADRLYPCGFDVVDSIPVDFESETALADFRAYLQSRAWRMAVWSGASDNTIFACPETNYAFRAWHDYHHVTAGLAFDSDGEREVCRRQCADILKLYDGQTAAHFCAILRAEVIGQLQHQKFNGQFPTDQMTFVRAYLDNPFAAVIRTY